MNIAKYHLKKSYFKQTAFKNDMKYTDYITEINDIYIFKSLKRVLLVVSKINT